jgi:hypothetical protein
MRYKGYLELKKEFEDQCGSEPHTWHILWYILQPLDGVAKGPLAGSQVSWSNMKHVLFICSRNRLRSLTAEQVFSVREDIAVSSAGLNHDAAQTVTPPLLEWADIIFVMEKAHLNRLRKRYANS